MGIAEMSFGIGGNPSAPDLGECVADAVLSQLAQPHDHARQLIREALREIPQQAARHGKLIGVPAENVRDVPAARSLHSQVRFLSTPFRKFPGSFS
jgi:hypothetical protein